MKRVAILQSNYIPWKGYFDLISHVDEFIIYDDMQYTRRDWRNRNQIKTPNGVEWLTIPVRSKGNYHTPISEIETGDSDWAQMHWRSLVANYARAPHFDAVAAWLEPLYRSQMPSRLSRINELFLLEILSRLGIATRITRSSDYELVDGKTERLVALCEQAGATEYVSGPSARDYVVAELFAAKGIQLSWFDYAGYPEYRQLWGDFTHGVTVLDLLFNCGADAPRFMKHVP